MGFEIFAGCPFEVAFGHHGDTFSARIVPGYFEKRLFDFVIECILQAPDPKKPFESRDSKVVQFCFTNLVTDPSTNSRIQSTRPQTLGKHNGQVARSILAFLSFALCLNVGQKMGRIPVAFEKELSSEEVSDAMRICQMSIIAEFSDTLGCRLFTPSLRDKLLTSPKSIVGSMRHVFDKAMNGILCNLSFARLHPECLYVTDFFAFQDIVPLVTIRCPEDLDRFPIIGGNLNEYIGFHKNPSSLNNGSILVWRGKFVAEEPTDSAVSEDYSSEGEGSDSDSDNV